MNRYKIIDSEGYTVTICVWDGISEYTPPEGCTIVPDDGIYNYRPNPMDWIIYQNGARDLLNDSDITVIRCIEKNIAVPSDLQQYREDLRNILRASTGDHKLPYPVKPPKPQGI